MSRRWWRASAVALVVGGAAVGCAGTEGPAVGLSAKAPSPPKAAGTAAEGALPFLPSHAIAELDDDGAFAAFARMDDGRGLLVFAQGGAWRARPLDRAGAPAGEIVTLAKIAGRATQLVVRATPEGFLAAWDVALDANHGISVVALDASGRPRGTPAPVAQVADRIGYLDLLVAEGAAYLLHEIPNRGARGQASRVVLTPIDARRGGGVGAGAIVVDDAAGWQITSTRRGAAVARVVAPAGAGAPGTPDLGRVEVAIVDARGVAGAPIVVTPRATAHIDVEIASLGDRLLVAWTDGGDAEGAAWVASVDPATGKATAPAQLSPPAEDVALVGLWAAPRGTAGRALVAWESMDQTRDPDAPRRFVLATVDAAGVPGGPRAELPFVGDGRPDVVPDGDGFAAMVLAPVALAGEAPAPGAPVWPTFVRLGPDLAARASEPLRAAPFGATEGIPDLAFGLSCAAGSCLAIGGAAGAPAPLSSIELPVRESPYRAAVDTTGGVATAVPVRAAEAATLFSGERVADVAAVRLAGGAELAAWVTWFTPGSAAPPPPKGEKPFAATLAVRPLGAAEAEPVVVSRRALSAGGVAMAALPGKSGEAVLGWVASEDGIPQVFATKVDAAGKKLAQKKVTLVDRGKKGAPTSECSGVDVAFAPQATDGRPGVVVAWVDTRDGDAEIYAARLNTNLEKVGADRRVTSAKGNASEVKVAVRGADTFVAFVEAREAPDNGDVYVTRLRTGNLDPVGEPTRVFASAGDSRGLRFVEADGGRLFVSWIDEAGRDPKTGASPDGTAAAAFRMVEIDASGKPAGAPRKIEGAGAQVLEGALGCVGGSCRGLVAVPGGPTRLLGVDVDGSTPGGSTREVGTAVGNRVPIAPLGGNGALFVVGEDDGRSGRVRALRLAW